MRRIGFNKSETSQMKSIQSNRGKGKELQETNRQIEKEIKRDRIDRQIVKEKDKS